MRTRYKRWAVEYLDNHSDLLLNEEKINDLYSLNKDIEIEIGSGKGDFIVSKSFNNSNILYFAVEKVDSVSGVLLKKIVENNISNAYLFRGDVEFLFPLLKKESINKIYLNFPDPWPKKGHLKRRLTYRSKLNEYYNLLKDKGELVIKTDNFKLYEFTLKECLYTPFRVIETIEGYKSKRNEEISEYEKKFILEKKDIYRILLRK